MLVVVLVSPPVSLLYHVHHAKLRQYAGQEIGVSQIIETHGGMGSEHNLVHLVTDTFRADDVQPLRVSGKRVISLSLYLEIELGGEAHATHHAKRVVAESDIRIQGRGDNAILQVGQPIERIHQLPETIMVEANGHGVDGEVAAVLVIFQRAVFHDGLSGVMPIAFFPGSHKFHLSIPTLHLRRTEIAEH